MNKILVKLKEDRSGSSAILITMLILSAILIAAFGTSNILTKGIVMGRSQVDSTKAFFAAEGGAERVIWSVRKHGLSCSTAGDIEDWEVCFASNNLCQVTCTTNIQTFSNGAEYSLFYDFEQTGGDSTTTLRSIGVYDQITRVIELQY
jgi:hypothetical protein